MPGSYLLYISFINTCLVCILVLYVAINNNVLNLPPEDNLRIKDRSPYPKVSFIRRFHCIAVIANVCVWYVQSLAAVASQSTSPFTMLRLKLIAIVNIAKITDCTHRMCMCISIDVALSLVGVHT